LALARAGSRINHAAIELGGISHEKEEAHTDHGTILKPDQAALVFDTAGRMSIGLPDMH